MRGFGFGFGTATRRRRLLAAAASALLALPAVAQDARWPSRTITIVVPYAAGGAVDQVTRTVAQRLASALGQTVVVENKPGASTMIAAQAVARAAPDGYTLLAAVPAIMTVNPSLYEKITYRVEDLQPVAMIGRIPLFVAVKPGSFRSLQELVERGRATELTYASAGIGSTTHLGTEMLKLQTGIKALHIPFKGNATALPEVATGRTDFALADLGSAKGLFDAGKLQVLAATSATRSKLMPSAPSMADVGIKDMDVATWAGIVGPRGMPAEVLRRIHDEVNRIISQPQAEAQLLAAGVEPTPMSREDFERQVAQEGPRWKKVIQAGNIKAE